MAGTILREEVPQWSDAAVGVRARAPLRARWEGFWKGREEEGMERPGVLPEEGIPTEAPGE